jgi:hypothetical protein
LFYFFVSHRAKHCTSYKKKIFEFLILSIKL